MLSSTTKVLGFLGFASGSQSIQVSCTLKTSNCNVALLVAATVIAMPGMFFLRVSRGTVCTPGRLCCLPSQKPEARSQEAVQANQPHYSGIHALHALQLDRMKQMSSLDDAGRATRMEGEQDKWMSLLHSSA
jgi:hypothetical protein